MPDLTSSSIRMPRDLLGQDFERAFSQVFNDESAGPVRPDKDGGAPSKASAGNSSNDTVKR
jgi:hypothetical protein